MPCQTTSLLPKHNFVFSERDFIYELCHELPNDVRLKSWRNFRKNSKLDGVEILVIAFKNYKKADIKVLWFCQTLLHYFYLFFIFGHDCRKHASVQSLSKITGKHKQFIFSSLFLHYSFWCVTNAYSRENKDNNFSFWTSITATSSWNGSL